MLRIEAIERHVDPRGELIKALPRGVPGEVYLVSAVPGSSRGHHLHRRMGEWFCALAGTGVLRALDPATGEVQEVPLEGVRVYVPAGIAHALVNTGEDDLLVLALADRAHDAEDVIPCPIPG